MRDLILLAALLGVAPFIARAPFLGLLTWIWLSLMNPHREVFSFLHGFELSFYVAALTAAAWLISQERKVPPPNPFTIFIVLFGLWACLSTYLALDREWSTPLWERTEKTIILTLAVATLANTRARLQAAVWMVAVSLGYYGVKGGGFVLMTGGRHQVLGPEASMIADNNCLGLALVVLLPLVNYLRLTSRLPAIRLACLATCGLTVLAIIGTYSRGALVAIGAAAAAYAIRTRSGLVVLLLGAALAASAPYFLPSRWFARMETIQTAAQDTSFTGRIEAWKTSWNIARARPLFGGGFSAVELTPVAKQYHSPGSLDAGRAAHSSYFEVLGDHGFVGLALYLLAIVAAVLNTSLVLANARGRPDLHWASQLARMLQVSIGAFVVGGAALSMAYFDGFLVVFALTAALQQTVQASLREKQAEAAEPRWRRLARQTARPLHPVAR